MWLEVYHGESLTWVLYM